MGNFIMHKIIVNNKGKCIVDTRFTDREQEDNRKKNSKENFYTLVIGENASGKSYLLFLVSEIFEYLDIKKKRHRKTKSLKYEYYNICYTINNQYYDVTIDNNEIYIYDYRKRAIEINELILPAKVIASSYLFNDKFKYSDNQNESIYRYCGVKNTSNAMFISQDSRKLLKNITNLIKNDKLEILNRTLFNIGYEEKITIKGVRSVKSRRVSIEELIDLRKNKRLVNRMIESIDLSTLNNLKKYTEKNEDLELELSLNFENFDNIYGINSFMTDIQYIDALSDIGFYSKIELVFYKDSEKVNFYQLSSGEKQILSTLLSIGAELEDDSLVLIDEPEVSLHPNWQITFMSELDKILGERSKSCHFIISTHSHLMVSSLYPERSSLIINSKDGYERKSELVSYDTFAWSAENILYRVFGVRTLRNVYIEKDLQRVINYLSKESEEDSLEEIKKIIENLKKIELTKDDPLVGFLKAVQEKI